jgi:hypothetical protein
MRPGIMTLQAKRIDELTEADLRALLDNQVPEGKCIDYKRELPGAKDAEKKDFLFDVSSFANASGGHLVYGMEEQGGVPKQLCGLSVDNQDKELLRFQGMILDGIDPRIPGLEIRFIPVADSKCAMIIHVPKSWNPPHMVTFLRANKFYTRNSAGKHLLDVTELRGLFAMSSSITDQVRRFRAERIGSIIADETPVAIGAVPRVVLHLIPLQALTSTSRIQLPLAATGELAHLLTPLGASGYNQRINLDGLLNYSTGLLRQPGFDAYLQLYHNGIIETVDASILSTNVDEKLIPSTYFARKLIAHVPQYLIVLQKLGISPPFIVMLTLIGVKGHRLAVNPRLVGGAAVDRDILLIPEITLDGFQCSSEHLRPLLDSVWNAAGWLQSLNFDPDGRYLPD